MTDIAAVLRAVAPRANPKFVAASANLAAIMKVNKIVTAAAQAQLIAQTAHESAGFTAFSENLSYSAARLVKVWPSRFRTIAEAQPFARNPKALANKVYNARMGNREGSNDGYDYRGSGALQHTGRSEFERVQRRTGLSVVGSPDLLRDPARADAMWSAACTFLVDRGALAYADAGQTDLVTKRINGGSIGLADRKLLVQRAQAALAGQPLPSGKTTTEQADDAKRRAKQATTAAPAGGGVAGGAADKGGVNVPAAIGVGIAVTAVMVVVAIVLWRRFGAKRAEVETMRLQSIDARLIAAEPVAS